MKIDSPRNATFKKLLSLTTSKGLRQEGLFLLSGEKLIREFLRQPQLAVPYQIIGAKMAALELPSGKTELVEFSADLFAQMDVLGTHFPLLALEQPNLSALTVDDLPAYQPKGIEVVAPFGDPGNLGALLRSCEAFGVPRVILTQEAAHPFLPKSVKASAGSALRLPLTYGPRLADFASACADRCIALDLDGIPIGDFDWPQDGLLLVGEEGPGLGAIDLRKLKHRIRIPTQTVESLNAVVAASIALAFRGQQAEIRGQRF